MCKMSFCGIFMTFIFSSAHEKFSLVLLQITNYIYSSKKKKKERDIV